MEMGQQAWVLACDVDDTLVPISDRPPEQQTAGIAALATLSATIEAIRGQADARLYFGSVTGRSLASHQAYEAQVPVFGAAADAMDFKVTSVGTESYIQTTNGFTRMADWPQPAAWQPDTVYEALAGLPELTLQPAVAQGDYKVSFDVSGESDDNHSAVVTKIARRLGAWGIAADVVFSGGIYLDILPQGVNKGTGLLHTVGALARQAGRTPFIIAAGDSMNDRDLLRVADAAILPANSHDSLTQWARHAIPPQKLYLAQKPFAAGILEGIDWLFNRAEHAYDQRS